jgi:hypothetical protein
VAAFLNGHEHPPTDYEVIHLGGTIELTATAFKERDGFNVLALDNGRLSYVRLVPGQRSKAMVTSPMRNELATRVFPDHRFQIRVISFSKNATRFNVSGDVTGSLQFQRRTASGAWLYAMDVNLPKGRYSIQISGDLQDKIHFAVGTEVPSFAEFQTLDLALESYPSLVRAAGLYLTLILLGMAFLPRALEVRFEGGYAYMNGDADTGSILGTVFSPLFIGFLLRNFPKFTKRCVVVLAVAPLLVPYRISWIKTAICFQFIWGYYSNGSFIFDPFGAYVAYYYFARIACGYMGFFSLLAFSGRLGRMCEGCLAVLFIASGIRVWERFDFDRPVSNRLLYFSPVFHMVPIMAAVALVVLFFQTRQNRRNSWPWASFVPGATSPPDAIL